MALRLNRIDNRWRLIVAGFAATLITAVISLVFGYSAISFQQLREAISAYDPTQAEHVVFADIRLPRLVGACLAGASLGMAGALLQGLTRNPLADPGILGVNAGAAVGVVLSIMVLGLTDPAQYVWIALISCVLVSSIVLVIGGSQDANPIRLLIAGAAVAAICLALIRAVLLVSRQTLDTYRFWVLGGLDGLSFDTIATLLPFLAVGSLLCVISCFGLNALALGTDIAKGLGVRVRLVQLITATTVILLCGTTVSMVGPIAFLGLVAAHIARPYTDGDVRWLVALSAIVGMVLLIIADLLGRLEIFGGSLQAGVMSALIGGPVLIWLIRRDGVSRV